MMRQALVLLTLCAAACSRSAEWKPTQAGEVFRYAAVGRASPLDSIVLGQAWRSAAKYGAHDADTAFALPHGHFAGADAISVHRDSLGIVRALSFAYHAKHDVEALVADYRASLGTPAGLSADSAGGVVRTTTRWQDDATEFIITTMTPPGADAVAAIAVLSDRRRPPH